MTEDTPRTSRRDRRSHHGVHARGALPGLPGRGRLDRPRSWRRERSPLGGSRHEWRFTRLSVVRVAKARRLERDLDLNPPGVALVLDLLDELDALAPGSPHRRAATDVGEH